MWLTEPPPLFWECGVPPPRIPSSASGTSGVASPRRVLTAPRQPLAECSMGIQCDMSGRRWACGPVRSHLLPGRACVRSPTGPEAVHLATTGPRKVVPDSVVSSEIWMSALAGSLLKCLLTGPGRSQELLVVLPYGAWVPHWGRHDAPLGVWQQGAGWGTART